MKNKPGTKWMKHLLLLGIVLCSLSALLFLVSILNGQCKNIQKGLLQKKTFATAPFNHIGHPTRPNIFYYSTIRLVRPFAECISFSSFLYGLSHLEKALLPGYILSTEREIPKQSDLSQTRVAQSPTPRIATYSDPGNPGTPISRNPRFCSTQSAEKRVPQMAKPKNPAE